MNAKELLLSLHLGCVKKVDVFMSMNFVKEYRDPSPQAPPLDPILHTHKYLAYDSTVGHVNVSTSTHKALVMFCSWGDNTRGLTEGTYQS